VDVLNPHGLRFVSDDLLPEAYRPDAVLVEKVMRRLPTAGSQIILDTIAERLYGRLELLKQNPGLVLDLGTGDARHLADVRRLFAGSTVIGADLSFNRLNSANTRKRFWQKREPLVCLDANKPLPFANGSCDLVVSNMLLPWIFDAQPLMRELNRVLAPKGAVFLSTAGPDTLIELRRAWSAIDEDHYMNAFFDMHDIGDLMVSAGIAEPVVDTERLTITYASVDALLLELSGLGFLNVLSGRRKGLTASTVKSRLAQHFVTNDDSRIDVTLELIVAHGWHGKPRERPQNSDSPQEVFFSLEKLRRK